MYRQFKKKFDVRISAQCKQVCLDSLGQPTLLNEEYINIKQVLEKLNYCDHQCVQWLLCVDLKMVKFLLGQQSGYTKYPRFICLWDSCARIDHWVKKECVIYSAGVPD